MSKERLEEIVEKITEQTYDRLIVPKTKIVIDYQDITYLTNTIIEQAERVQELEELEQEYVDLNNDFTELAIQSKRYREALEDIIELSYSITAVEEIAKNVLEESE